MRRATVWWRDAHLTSASLERSDIERNHRPLRLGKTGWVVLESEIGISLAMDWAAKDGANTGQDAYEFRMCCFIPAAMIESVEYLAEQQEAR